MRKSLLLSTFIGLSSLLAAQNSFTLTGAPTATGTLGARTIETRGHIKNNTGNSLTLAWARQYFNAPMSWECSLNTDLSNNNKPDRDAGSFTLMPGRELDLRATFYPHGAYGAGEMRVIVYNPYDSVSTAQVISFNATNTNTALADNSKSTKFNVYPMPAVDYFQFDDAEGKVGRVEVWDLIGKKLATFYVNATGERYNVGNLPRGLYLLRFYDKSGNALFTQRISKNNP